MLTKRLKVIGLTIHKAIALERLHLCIHFPPVNGCPQEARAEANEVFRIDPAYTVRGTQTRLSFFSNAKHAEHFYVSLRKAGLPE